MSWVSGPARDRRGPITNIWFKTLMHLGSYLMIAALLLMGLEMIYALYQLATFVL